MVIQRAQSAVETQRCGCHVQLLKLAVDKKIDFTPVELDVLTRNVPQLCESVFFSGTFVSDTGGTFGVILSSTACADMRAWIDTWARIYQ